MIFFGISPLNFSENLNKDDFNPLKLNSISFELKRAKGKSYLFGFPLIDFFSISTPPGYYKPNNLAPLSNASPAASSLVSPNNL